MTELPTDLKYAKTHEWLRDEGNGEFSVGITDHAQQALGDLVFVELPSLGSQVAGGDECAVVESVKSASDIYAPISGEISAVNEALENAPELVNNEPYAGGWLFRIKATDPVEINDLLDAAGYRDAIED